MEGEDKHEQQDCEMEGWKQGLIYGGQGDSAPPP